MSKPTIALTDGDLVERVIALTRIEHRTKTEALRLLVALGLGSYDFTGSILCLGKARCQRPACSCRTETRSEDAAAGSVVRFPRPSA